MSGGHWDYLGFKLEDYANCSFSIHSVFRFLAACEHELDWGISGDDCRECAVIRVGEAMIRFFDEHCIDETAALAVVRDRDHYLCRGCFEWFGKERRDRFGEDTRPWVGAYTEDEQPRGNG